MGDCNEEIASQVQDAFHSKTALQIQAGNTKAFYGRNIHGELLSLANHTGIIEYEPTELYMTARCGTPLREIEQTIDEQNQILPCEPPHFGSTATIGGMIAAGLAGPRRVFSGNVRDCMLGVEILNGEGQTLRFGGKVMKNVAGYDVSRLMCGALGTLGVLMSVTIRLLPKPTSEQTIALTMNSSSAIQKMNQWANSAMPITATFYDGNQLFIRISGSTSTIDVCRREIGGEIQNNNKNFWNTVKEQTHKFFNTKNSLWRISLPPSTKAFKINGNCAVEWNGALRWYDTTEDEKTIRTEAEQADGHACLFKGNTTEQVFHPLPDASMHLHKQLKHVLDPANILNPGKMFAEF